MCFADAWRAEQYDVFSAFDERHVAQFGKRLAIERWLGIDIKCIQTFERWEMRKVCNG